MDLEIWYQNSLLLAQEKLQEFIIDVNFNNKIQLAFGDNVDIVTTTSLLREFAKLNSFLLPKIEICSELEINGAKGAFSGSNYAIYLSQKFLEQNCNNSGAIVNVILEELGHGVDWKLHPSLDTLGDEGEIFSDLVRGVELSESELQRIKTEDDRVMINIDGQTLGLEQATSIFLSNLPSARGIYVDSYNNVLVSELVVNSQTFTPESWIAKYNSNAQLINAKILGGTTVIKLAAAPSFGGVIGLRDDGLVFSLDPNTLTSRQLFNLRQISVDTSAVYNFTNQNLEPTFRTLNCHISCPPPET